MCFHKPTLHAPLTSLEHHPPHEPPYLLSITIFHKMGLHTFSHLTRWHLNSSPIPPHKKSRYNFSMRSATLAGIGNKDKKYVSRLDSVLFIKVILPPFARYILFQPAKRRFTFSITVSQTEAALEATTNGRPTYVIGSEAVLHPKVLANCRRF
ncbi:hypothetical protein I3842_14G091900 [Carya illinoinensis]|uniref:Uncharacterized protein n=1 Tax=Carya illinoinensis TaxID=32201 RepID=A0A922ABP1_CARIL|nr:hypothetical protein I3842_14G091900 [Carya illinoinensis]